MKKLILTFAITVSILTASAQEAKVISAWNYLNDYKSSTDPTYLERAKEEIDLASENPDTKDKSKTQIYKGQIYLELFKKKLRLENEKNKDQDPEKREAACFQAVSTTELIAAYEALSKAKLLDPNENYKDDINNGITEITVYISKKAVYDYNAKNYVAALYDFEKTYEITGFKDTSTLANMAITAERTGNFEKAKLYYQKMVNEKTGLGSPYVQLANTYLALNDTIAAIEILKKGRMAFPNDINLLRNEIDVYLKANRISEALTSLNQAIALQPTDAILYFARGNQYDHLSNSKEKELEKSNDPDERLNRAEADYKKAIELKPDYFDALYNLGALYYNKGVLQTNKVIAITDQENYKIEIAKANEEFAKALPILEKAYSINNTDVPTIKALKNIYYQLQMKEKGDEMKAKIGN